MFASAVVLFCLAFASLVTAQLTATIIGLSGLSAQCQASLLGVLANSAAATCLNLPGLITVATTVTGSSVIHPLDQWLDGLCAAPACSDATLAAVATNLTSGCASDLPSVIQPVVGVLQGSYPVTHSLVCLENTQTKTLCLTEFFTDVQTFLGQPVTLSNFATEFSTLIKDLLSGTVPQSLFCTACTQAAFNLVKQDTVIINDNPFITTAVTTACGTAFADDTTPPSNIVEGTGALAPSPTALTLDSSGSSFAPSHVLPLLALAGAFFVFAA